MTEQTIPTRPMTTTQTCGQEVHEMFSGKEIPSGERASKQFKHFISQLRKIWEEQAKTPEGREALRRDLCAMQGRPLGPCFEGETIDNWKTK